MPGALVKAAGRGAQRVPGLRRIPILKLLIAAEVATLAREQFAKLTPAEWRRMVELLRLARGRPRNLGPGQRRELDALVAKAEPRLFAGQAIETISPVAIPARFLYGPGKRR